MPLLLAVVFSLPLSAGEVLITGTAPGAARKSIRIYTCTDLLTYNEILLAQAPVDNNQQFSIRLKLDDTSLLTLRIDFLSAQLYAVPGEVYRLLFDTLKPGQYKESSNPYLNPVYLNYQILNAGPGELNNLIFSFDSLLNAFVNENAAAIIGKKVKMLTGLFQSRSDSLFGAYKNEYFRVYRMYKTALFEESLYVTSPSKLFEKYFLNKPVLTHNEAYMEFFNQYFKMYFTDLSHPVKFSSVEYVINESCSYPALLDTLSKDSNLLQEPLREMVIIKGLRELYGLPGLKKENIISLLTTLAEKSRYPHNALTARMVIKYLSGYPKGTQAADFTLTDKKLQPYKLSQFKGRYVYLFFWNTSCTVCLSEMGLLNDLKRKYNGRLEIMGISIDLEPLNMYYLTDKSKFDFPLLHFAFNYNITDNFAVKTLPYFVLLDTEGYIVNAPALKPSENIYRQLDSLFFKK